MARGAAARPQQHGDDHRALRPRSGRGHGLGCRLEALQRLPRAGALDIDTRLRADLIRSCIQLLDTTCANSEIGTFARERERRGPSYGSMIEVPSAVVIVGSARRDSVRSHRLSIFRGSPRR